MKRLQCNKAWPCSTYLDAIHLPRVFRIAKDRNLLLIIEVCIGNRLLKQAITGMSNRPPTKTTETVEFNMKAASNKNTASSCKT